MTEMTPREIVHALDQHIVGQGEAKRAVAIALRNRWRRLQLAPGLREEVTPKNILMIGPTGVGKTEIARRLAKLARAPFLKVEATKFTEVGYVGRDVDAMIRDLAEAAYQLLRQEEIEAQRPRAQDAAEQRLLDALLPAARGESESRGDSSARQLLRKQLREGTLDEREVTLGLAGRHGSECHRQLQLCLWGSRREHRLCPQQPKPAPGARLGLEKAPARRPKRSDLGADPKLPGQSPGAEPCQRLRAQR